MPIPDFAPLAPLLAESGRRALGLAPNGVAAASRTTDWAALPDAAERHGMSAWVHASMPGWPDAPAHVRDLIAERSRHQRMRALAAVSQLTTVVGLLTRAGIDVVALKGPLFSQWLYGDAGLRRLADLDVLIAAAHRAPALDALRSAGYALPGGLSAAAARTVYAGTGAWPLTHDTAIGMDLHWKLQAFGFGAPLDAGAVLRDSVSVVVAGSTIRIPSATDAATLTLVHAAKHLWSSLELTLAIAGLMRRDDVDWARVYESTRRAGTWRGAAVGVALAREIFHVEVPPVLRDPLDRTETRPLVRAACEFLAMPDVAGAPLRAEVRAHCAALDGTRHRARYAAWRLLAPTPLEPAWCRLPDRLAPLYAPMRLIRLLVRQPGNDRVICTNGRQGMPQ